VDYVDAVALCVILVCQTTMKEGRNLQIIEWGDLDKKTFYSYSLCMSGVLRFTIYPMNLVKTRLQVSFWMPHIVLLTYVVGLFALNKMCDKKCSVSSTIQYNCHWLKDESVLGLYSHFCIFSPVVMIFGRLDFLKHFWIQHAFHYDVLSISYLLIV